ncbi:class I SAM-dependent methyltransferase [Stackebrandtia nassauensis]|nr:class I SAM-dependent methyltransferase [Stackebrandtia nassauensis]
MSNPREFYDDFAEAYDGMFADWDASIARQARVFAALLGEAGQTILDCSCGIGTQALGLAALGFHVTGTDISPASVARARREAAARGVALPTAAADMRALPFLDDSFDAVLCVDNALCHVLDADGVVTALRETRRVLRGGGRLILSVRDYDEARRSRPRRTPPQLSRRDGQWCVTFQLWHWDRHGDRYDFEHFQLRGSRGEWRMRRRVSRLWALTREELGELASRAGFSRLEWLAPADSGFYQPVLVAG